MENKTNLNKTMFPKQKKKQNSSETKQRKIITPKTQMQQKTNMIKIKSLKVGLMFHMSFSKRLKRVSFLWPKGGHKNSKTNSSKNFAIR